MALTQQIWNVFLEYLTMFLRLAVANLIEWAAYRLAQWSTPRKA